MTMDADTAHLFWLGKVNVSVAMARGSDQGEGPVAKILKLVPLTNPVFPRYKAQLERAGTDRDGASVSAGDEAEAWPQGSRRSPRSRGRSLRAGRRAQPARRAGGAVPRRNEPDHRPARARFLGGLLRRRGARGGRPVQGQGGTAASRPDQGPHARPDHSRPGLQRRVAGADRRGPARAQRLAQQGPVREHRLQPALPRNRSQPVRPDCPARAVQPRFPRLGRGHRPRRRLRHLRPPDLFPVAPARAHAR